MIQPFWEHYDKKFWREADWQAWEKAGRPRVPPDMELESPPAQEIGNTLPAPPPGPQLAPGWFTKPSRRDASARSRGVDQLIEKHVGRR